MIGWNENLHTLGPPWQRLDIPRSYINPPMYMHLQTTNIYAHTGTSSKTLFLILVKKCVIIKKQNSRNVSAVGAIIILSLADFVGLPTYKEWNCIYFFIIGTF